MPDSQRPTAAEERACHFPLLKSRASADGLWCVGLPKEPEMERLVHCVIISGMVVIALFIAPSLLAISEKDADKFVNEYESMSQRFLGFFNCISKTLTGSEVISAQDPKLNQKMQGVEMGRPTLSLCFSRMGLKLGPGFAKLTDLFSRSASKSDSDRAKEGGDIPQLIDPGSWPGSVPGSVPGSRPAIFPQRSVTKERTRGSKQEDHSNSRSEVAPKTKPRW